MTIDAREDSDFDAEPVLLLLFERAALRFSYVTGDTAITHASRVYEPSTITVETGISAKPQDGLASMRLSVPRNHEIFASHEVIAPANPTRLTIFYTHYGETEAYQVWAGEVNFAERSDNKGKLTLDADFKIFNRNVLPYRHGPLCQHAVYRGGCDLPTSGHSHSAVIATVGKYTITSADFSGLNLNQGVAVLGNNDYRTIVKHDGDVATLDRPFDGVLPGATIVVLDGCDRSRSRCKELGNFEHYLGFNTRPTDNIFETGLRY